MATKNNQKIRDMVELLALTGKEMLPLAREGKNYKVTTKTLSEYIGSTGGGSLPTDAAAQIKQNTENIEIIQNNITSLSNQLDNNKEEIDDLGQLVNFQKTDIQNNSNRLDSIEDDILDISGDIEGLKSLATTTSSGLMSAQDKMDLNTLMVFYEGTDTDSTINSWKELEKFLEDFDTTKDLADLLTLKADQSSVDSLAEAIEAINEGIVDLTTDDVYEGANKYFTNARAITALSDTLKGYVTTLAFQDYAVQIQQNSTNITKLNETVDKIYEEYVTSEDIPTKTSQLIDDIGYALARNIKALAGLDIVTKDYIADAAVTTSKIKDGAITSDKLSTAIQQQLSWIPSTTDDLPEGSSNLYFTNDRAIAALSDTLTLKADKSFVVEINKRVTDLEDSDFVDIDTLRDTLDPLVTSLQGGIDSLWSRDSFDELYAGHFMADSIAAERMYADEGDFDSLSVDGKAVALASDLDGYISKSSAESTSSEIRPQAFTPPSDRWYKVYYNSAVGKMYVNVPWVDTGATDVYTKGEVDAIKSSLESSILLMGNRVLTIERAGYLTSSDVYPLLVKDSNDKLLLEYSPTQRQFTLKLQASHVGLGNVENTKLSTWAGSANITTLGTITSGIWNGDKIGQSYLDLDGYLTSSIAESTYLKKEGGQITGNLLVSGAFILEDSFYIGTDASNYASIDEDGNGVFKSLKVGSSRVALAEDIDNFLTSLQGGIDSLWSRDSFDELYAGHFMADSIAAERMYADEIEVSTAIMGNNKTLTLFPSRQTSEAILPIKISKIGSQHTLYCDEAAAYDLGTSACRFAKVYCTEVYQSSDASLKDISGDIPLTVGQIANAPAVLFKWKRGIDEAAHVGTIAQYWKGILPEVVSGEEGSMSIEEATLAVVNSIVLARAMERYEKRMAILENEINELKNR